MTRYILDTEAIIWFLEKNPRLPKDIREDIEYLQYEYYISFLSLMEIDNLRKLGKIELPLTTTEILKQLNESYIGVYYGDAKDLKALDILEMKTINQKTHGDYIDRMIISLAIAKHHTCISSDKKFPYYRKDGLSLLEI
jgi:PIN domain nuclease of toxin-antitoxin system